VIEISGTGPRPQYVSAPINLDLRAGTKSIHPPRAPLGHLSLLGYSADDEPMPIAAREKPQDMLDEVLHTLSDANLLIRFHAHEIPLAGVQPADGRELVNTAGPQWIEGAADKETAAGLMAARPQAIGGGSSSHRIGCSRNSVVAAPELARA
jgi:hypothetical protein